MQDRRDLVLEKVELLLAELTELRSQGPHFRIHHRFHKPATDCLPGEEVLAVCLVHRGREYSLHLSLALRLIFDYLARHPRFPQSAAQIEAGIRADCFYKKHGTATMGTGKLTRSIPRSYVRVYIDRLRTAMGRTFDQAGFEMDPATVLVSHTTAMNEVGYQLRATLEWVHIDN
jgi:hypothetical protein